MFENLPVELLQCVFMLLSPCLDFPNVLRVCKRWHDVCKEVMKIREYRCFSAFKLESPLKWIVPKTTHNGTSTPCMPSKRFGSTVVYRNSLVYVFGGATSMFTTFNDLWVYDLCTKNWKRLLADGDLPTPRAHAKGGFIDDNLFLFGGCQSFHHPSRNYSGQINWLNDLCKFHSKRLCWSKISLKLAHMDIIQSPPVNGGQSGCFLPASPDGDPSLLVLFGGISPQSGLCTSDLCIICPEEGRWLFLTDEHNPTVPWPAGRCGHAVCSLDASHMLVMFGNRDPPSAMTKTPERNEPGLDQPHGDPDKPYQGQPAADIWILARCQSVPGQDWRYSTWFWTKVHCPISVPGCPPVDFYHSAAIRLPYTGRTNGASVPPEEDLDSSPVLLQPITNSDQTVTYTVMCISQPTEHLLEEAARQRRNWRQRSLSCSFEPRSSSGLSEPNEIVSISPPLSNGSSRELLGATAALSSGGCVSASSSSSRPPVNGQDIFDGTPGIHSTSLPSGRRSLDRRAKRLEALAAQERRLFGSRSSTPLDRILQASQNVAPNAGLLDDGVSDKNPLAIYCLSICVASPRMHAIGTWLLPKKLEYIDLLGGPHDCLGFSCTFGTGCLFLFGGLRESDEPVTNEDGAHNVIEMEAPQPGPWRPLNDLPNANDSCASMPLGSPKSNPQLASFYVLQPRGLVGTVV